MSDGNPVDVQIRETSYEDAVRKYSDRGTNVNIAVGLRPSGVIHIGNMSALTLAAMLARDVGPHISRVNVTICDSDLPDYSDWNVKRSRVVRYFRDIPDRDGCHRSLLDHANEGIGEFVGGLERSLGIGIEVQHLFDV